MNSNTFSELDGKGLKIAIVTARFNQELTDAMLEDCGAGLQAAQVEPEDILELRVPGSFELPTVAAELAGQKIYDAIICLGVIIKGETRHDEYIASSVAEALQNIAVQHHVPVIFGVLTTENREQAIARAMEPKRKGWESAMSAVEMASLFKQIKKSL